MRFIMDDPRKAADVYVQAMPRMHGREGVLEQIFRAYIQQTYSGQPIAGRVDPARSAALQNLYLQQGFIQGRVPVDELYTNSFIPTQKQPDGR